MKDKVRVRYSDRNRTMNFDLSTPRWTAFVSVFDDAYNGAGTGSTRKLALQSAIADLPSHVRRHFEDK